MPKEKFLKKGNNKKKKVVAEQLQKEDKVAEEQSPKEQEGRGRRNALTTRIGNKNIRLESTTVPKEELK